MRILSFLFLGALFLNTAFGLSILDRVKTNSSTPVRNTAGGTQVGTQPSGRTGIITGGPQTAVIAGSGSSTSYTWWYVNFDTAPAGWVISTSIDLDPAGQFSDLVPQNLGLTPNSGQTGSTVLVAFKVINKGLAPSRPTTVHIRLSPSSSAPGTVDPLLGSINIGSLGVGAQQVFAPSYPIPPGTATGQWYVWIVLDPDQTAHQGSQIDNDRAKALFTIYSPTQNSDLVPQNLSLTPNGGAAGANVQVGFKVINNGAFPSLATTARIQLSASPIAPDPDDLVLGSVAINSLVTGSQQLFSPSYSIPAGTAAGQWYIWVVVDPAGGANQGPNIGNDRIRAGFPVSAGATLSWRLPLDGSWLPTQAFFASAPTGAEPDRRHLGLDVSRSTEVPVYAIGNGTVRYSASSESSGRVVVVEHTLPNGTSVCSTYGHLRLADMATVGAEVAKGDVIGYLSNSAEDTEEAGTHLHFGIRMGAYSTDPDPDGQWRYREYGPQSVAANWYDPTTFINSGGNPAASTPIISPSGGTFELSAEVTLTAAPPGAVIRYTTDGRTPTAASPLYEGPVTLERSATLKAKAFANGYTDSPVASAAFTVRVPVLALGGLVQTYDGTPRVVTVTITGVSDGHTPAVTYAGSATPPTDAGSYPVVASLGSARKTGTLVVRKKPLAVTAVSTSRLLGQPNPEFYELTYDGFAEGDTEADLDPTLPAARAKATLKSAQGDYPITISGGLDNNYAFVAGTPVGKLTVLGFGGTYEALLVDDSLTPVGKLTLAVANNAFSYTGTLTLVEAAGAVGFKSVAANPLVPAPDAASASGTILITVNGTACDLAFVIDADGTLAGDLDRDAAPFAALTHGARVVLFPKGTPAPGAGANTLALHPAYVLFDEDQGPIPGGSGHATAKIAAATGVLTVKGKVADGLPLTASLKPTTTGYQLWTNPYGSRPGSFLAGLLTLQPHPDQTRFPERSYIPSDEGLLIWQKAALPESTALSKRDRSYRDGFGPLGLQVSLDPWLPPSARTTATLGAGTLAQRLGLVTDTAPGVFAIAHDTGDLDLGEREDALPFEASLASNGVLTASDAADTAWKITLTPATGAFSGSFVLSDQINPLPAKPTLRKVTFTGTLRQAPDDDTIIGTGCFLVPGFDKTDEQPSGEIRFTAPAPAP